jgi:8-oxo-dGTP pyrophosphatase MutT (NUDIX family)
VTAPAGSADGAGAKDVSRLPGWLQPLIRAARQVRPEEISRFTPPAQGGRPSAVLILLAEGPDGPDVLLIERAEGLRKHAGQPAFPGGAVDATDSGPIDAALREAVEEVGIDVAGVDVVAVLPDLFLPVSSFVVTPVLAWWHTPGEVRAVDEAEVAGVVRVPIQELADPAHRVRVQHPSGFAGPGFAVRDLLVWGFTAGLLDAVLRMGGWEQPWQPGELHSLEGGQVSAADQALVDRILTGDTGDGLPLRGAR